MNGNNATRFDFDTIAASYDKWYASPVGKYYDDVEKRAVARILPSPQKGARLLEVGCGTGHWSEFFAEKGFDVTGVDISPEMIRIARAKNIPRARFEVANAVALPFDDETFDVAVAITVLEFAKGPVGVLAEMVRCVRTGGKVIVGVLNRYSPLAVLRKLRHSPVFENAHLYSRGELLKLLSFYGRARVGSVAYVLPWRSMVWASPLFEFLGRSMRLGLGDFLIGEINLEMRGEK